MTGCGTQKAAGLLDVERRMAEALGRLGLAGCDATTVLMVSGGSDSTALAYAAAALRDAGALGACVVLHVNHLLRGRAAEDDARFAEAVAHACGMAFQRRDIDVATLAHQEGGNVEAVGRHARYEAAFSLAAGLERDAGAPEGSVRVLTAHTRDDRVENFFMRAIVGAAPGGLRGMRRQGGRIVRPLLDETRESLRSYLRQRAEAGCPCVCDAAGALWREDATNADVDRLRAFVRSRIVPAARERNPQLSTTLARTMDLVADEDDFLEELADAAWSAHVAPIGADAAAGFVLAPQLGAEPLVVRRRVVARALRAMLGDDARLDARSVASVVAALGEGVPASGYVDNVQGDIAVSANKRGVRVEPMAALRARRKRV